MPILFIRRVWFYLWLQSQINAWDISYNELSSQSTFILNHIGEYDILKFDFLALVLHFLNLYTRRQISALVSYFQD